MHEAATGDPPLSDRASFDVLCRLINPRNKARSRGAGCQYRQGSPGTAPLHRPQGNCRFIRCFPFPF